MKHGKKFHSPGTTPETPRNHPGSPESRVTAKKFPKVRALLRLVQAQPPLTTETLGVPGIDVVGAPKGKAFAGPYYPDQLDQLRSALREMPRREKFVVTETTTGFWIHRKS